MKNTRMFFFKFVFFIGGVFLPSFFILAPVFADTLILKNGKELKGLVVERHADRIILSTQRGETPILLSGIKDIKYDDPEQNFFQIAKGYEAENKLGEALAYYEKALEVNPDFEDAKKAALAVRNHFWASSAEGPMNEIEKKQTLYDAWEQGKTPEAVIKKKLEEDAKLLKNGLGISLEKKGDWTRLESVFSGKPAVAAGMKRFDRLVAIDGESLRYLLPEAIAKKLLIPHFTNFNLEVERDCVLEKSGAGNIQDTGLDFGLGYAGLFVKSVQPDSAASRAGIREDDLVTAIDGEATRYLPIKKVAALIQKSKRPSITISVRRSMLLARR